MAFNWLRPHRYAPVRSFDDPETALKYPSHFATWMSSKRMRSLLTIAIMVALLFAMSQYRHVTDQLQSLSSQRVDENSKNTTQLPDAYETNRRLGENQPQESADGSDSDDDNSSLSTAQATLETTQVTWSDFAYIQYVTNANYLCNSLMILEALHRLKSKADRIMIYPEQWQVPSTNEAVITDEGRLLVQARDQYKVKLIPVTLQSFDRGDPTWKDSYTKLLAFNQTQYKRLISLDSDSIVRDTMDELFLLPSSTVAIPRAYWLDQPRLSSQIMVVEPSVEEWNRIKSFLETHEDSGFDMDVLNTLYINSALIIPHRRYDLLTSELRANRKSTPNPHAMYLGSPNAIWNGSAALAEAKFVHFSDWPVPKPWIGASDATYAKEAPKCVEKKGLGGDDKEVEFEEDCTDRDIWYGLYKEYREKRKQICGRETDMRRRSTASERRSVEIARPWFEPVLP